MKNLYDMDILKTKQDEWLKLCFEIQKKYLNLKNSYKKAKNLSISHLQQFDISVTFDNFYFIHLFYEKYKNDLYLLLDITVLFIGLKGLSTKKNKRELLLYKLASYKRVLI